MKLAARWTLPMAVLAACVALLGPGPAASASAATRTLSNHQIAGKERSISCLTATRCVAVGQGVQGGYVVTVVNDKPTHVRLVRTGDVFAVSCPSSRGCWAVAHRRTGVNMLEIGPAGLVIKQVAVKEPKGVHFTQISCAKMTDCELISVTGVTAAATWTGRNLTVHRYQLGQGFDQQTAGASCSQGTCQALLNMAFSSATGAGVVVTVKGGKPLSVNYYDHDAFYAVSCVSAVTCYATGAHVTSSAVELVLFTLTNGVPTSMVMLPDAMIGLECEADTCVLTGSVHAPHGQEYGALITVRDGVVGTPVIDQAVNGFLPLPGAVTRRGHGFAALAYSLSRNATMVTYG